MFSVCLLLAFAVVSFFVPTLALPHVTPPIHSVARRGTPDQINAFLDSHNVVRAQHNATALTWSPSLAAKAASWADQCEFKHTDGVLSNELYGENIVAGTGEFGIPAAVAKFVEDQGQYNPANPTYLHFTQVVWKATTELGCAVSQCRGIFSPSLGPASLYVCLYNPVGNVVGQAPENVQV